jgi:Ca2+-binding RTX toxin-like protein
VYLNETIVNTSLGHYNDTIYNVENIYGTKYNDIICGDEANNSFTPYTGNDIMYGNGGNDSIIWNYGLLFGCTLFLYNNTFICPLVPKYDLFYGFEILNLSNYNDIAYMCEMDTIMIINAEGGYNVMNYSLL